MWSWVWIRVSATTVCKASSLSLALVSHFSLYPDCPKDNDIFLFFCFLWPRVISVSWLMSGGYKKYSPIKIWLKSPIGKRIKRSASMWRAYCHERCFLSSLMHSPPVLVTQKLSKSQVNWNTCKIHLTWGNMSTKCMKFSSLEHSYKMILPCKLFLSQELYYSCKNF